MSALKEIDLRWLMMVYAGTGESMLLVHLGSGLGYLTDAARELGRLGFRAQRDDCERVIQDCKDSSRG